MNDTSRIDIAVVDLAKTLLRENYGTLLATGDEYANRFGATIVRHGETVDITGYAVTGSFIRPDGVTLNLDGTAEGNTVYIDLTAPCYNQDGVFTLSIKIIKDDVTETVRMVDGYLRRTDTGNFVATEETIITLDQMKGIANELTVTNQKAQAMMDDLEEAVDEVEQVIEDASHVADKLPHIGANGNWMQWDDESGAFVDSGSPSRGAKGDPGYTPQKGTDYVDGKDGTSVTVSGVSESTADGGNNVVTFSDGKKLTVKNGTKGSQGDPGYTPQKGVDYRDGVDGVGIQSVAQTTTSTEDGGSNVITVTKTNGSTSTFTVRNGNKGKDGKDGTGVTILGNYDSEAALKAAHPTGNPGDAYMVDGYLYVWSVSGNAWQNVGKIQGPQGNPGNPGKDGTSVTVASVSESTADGGSNVVTFSDGKTLTVKNGSKGSQGNHGTSVTVSNVSESTADGGNNVVTFSDGKTVTIKNGSKGSQGNHGTSVTVSNVSESTADGGNNVVTFSDGKTVTIKNGNKGSDGYTPQKGVDYRDGVDGKNAVTSAVALTIPSTAWTGSEAPYTSTVACSGVTASNHIIVGAGGALTAEQQAAMAAAMIVCTGQGANTITLSAFGAVPEIDLPVNVMIVG